MSIVDAVDSISSTRGRPSISPSSRDVSPSNRYSSATHVEEQKHQDAENYTIKCKNSVAVSRDVTKKNRNREPARDSRSQDTRDYLSRDSAMLKHFPSLENDCGSNDRHAHEEAEDRGRLPVELEPAPGCHRGARPGYTRHKGD